MDIEKLKILVKLGLIETFQSYLEGDDYYYTEDENTDDDFFKKDLEDED